MQLHLAEIPTAHAMIDLIRQSRLDPVQEFLCYWTAFENICAALARHAGLAPSFALRRNGTIETRKVGKIKIVQARAPSEEALLDLAFAQLSVTARHRLIVHPSATFFAQRKPTWNGAPVEIDGFGQRLTGIIDASRTADIRYPVWSPFQASLYKQYVAQGADDKTRDLLARQIFDILYIVRRNLTQSGDPASSENDPQVIASAIPLLSIVVLDFLPLST